MNSHHDAPRAAKYVATTVTTRISGATTRPQEQQQRGQDDGQDEREDQGAVPRGGVGSVERPRLSPAHVGAGSARERSAKVADHLARLVAARGGRNDDLHLSEPVGGAAGGGQRHPWHLRGGPADLLAAALGDDDEWVGAASGEGPGQPLGRRDGLGFAQELVGRRQPGADLEQPGCEAGEQQTGDDDEGTRSRSDPVANPPPPRAGLGEADLADPRDQRPEDPAAEEDQGRRQHDECIPGGHDDADRAGQAKAAGCRERGEQQGQQREHDGGRADQDGLAGPPQGPAHRGIPVRLGAQLVAVPRDEQQGVVRAGPEDKDREDADGGLVPGRPGRTEHVRGQHGGQPVRDPHDDKRDDPQDRAAVGDDEQERNDRGGGEQQPGVGAVEDGTQVGLRSRPGP